MASKIYEEYLELAGFEGKELQEILPDWIEATKRIGLSEKDVEFAVKEWIPKNWDIQYLGIRKMIGAYTREAIDVSKTKEYKENGVKIIYGILPAIVANYDAFKLAGGDKVFVSFPDIMLVMFINGFFNKLDPYLEIAEETGMSYGCRHCALNKTRIAAQKTGLIANPDIIWSWGFNCDEGPKTDEYINCLSDGNDWNHLVSRVPHDTHFGEIDDEIPERVEFIAEQMRYGMKEVEKATGIKVTDEHLAIANKNQASYTFKFATLTSLVCKGDPQPLGGTSLTGFCESMFAPFNTGMKYMEEALDITIKEVRQAIKDGVGILPKGSPKVPFYFTPIALPWISQIFKENGVGTTFSLIITPSKKQFAPSKYKDPYMQASESWLRMTIGQNLGYDAKNMIEKLETNMPCDGLVMGFFDFDRWLGAHHKIMAKLLEEATDVPTFYIEADFWEDRDYSPESLRTRIESICQIIKMKKGID